MASCGGLYQYLLAAGPPSGDPPRSFVTAAPNVVDPPSKRRRVIVVGAGMAGLGAARALSGSGLEGLILEASDRVGGRVWGQDFAGLPVDLGAMFIEGTSEDNPIMGLMGEYGLDLQMGKSRQRVGFDQGKRLSKAETVAASRTMASGLSRLKRCGHTGEPNDCHAHVDTFTAAQQVLEGILPEPYPDDNELQTSERSRRLSNEMRGKELYYGAGLEVLSAK